MSRPGRFKLTPAVHIVLRRNRLVLLSLRARTGYQDGQYSFVAGHLEGDEFATDAAIREAHEEIGIELDASDLVLVHVAHRLSRSEVDQERIDLFFESRRWSGHVENCEPDRCDGVEWFDPSSLPANTVPFVRLVLRAIEAGLRYSQYPHEPTAADLALDASGIVRADAERTQAASARRSPRT